MAIGDDVAVSAAGLFTWTGPATHAADYSVLEFIQFCQGLMDDEQSVGDDFLDITVDTPIDRSTDQILKINWPFQVTDTLMSHLYDGSVEHALDANNALGSRWSGIEVLGPVVTGEIYMILQAGRVLPAFWATGINAPGGASLVFSRHLVKSIEGGAQIDGGRVVVLARTLNNQFRRFPVQLGTANATAAISNGDDIFNNQSDAALAAIVDIVNVFEGFQELNIDGSGAAGQEFFSQWDKGANSINDSYEYTKFISQNAHITDATGGAPTGADFVIENATIVGQAQSFIPSSVTEQLTEARAQIKILAGAPTGVIYAELWDSDDVGGQLAKPTGGALARSEDIPAEQITSTYAEVIFRFNRKDPTGVITAQATQRDLNNPEYFIVFRHDAGDAGNNFSLEGASTDQDATMNQADDTAAVWTASATDDINITVKSSPELYTQAGEVFEGISLDVGFDGESGTGVPEQNICNWGTQLTTDTYVGTFIEGEHVRIFVNGGTVVKNGGQLLHDDGVNDMIIALDDISSNLLDNDDIVGVDSGATAKIAVTITNQDKGGGTGLVLAKDDNGVTGELYIQLITGVSPVNNSRIYASGDVLNFADATAVIVARTIVPEFLGQSTGSNIIGAYGEAFEITDVGSSDKFLDLSNTSRTPPNNVIFTVSGLISGEDRVLVGPRTGALLDRGQWLLATALTGATEVLVIVKTGTDTVPWPAAEINWPATGQAADVSALRIQLDTGRYRNVDYESHDSSDRFTILSSDFSGVLSAAINQNVWLAFIDLLAIAATATFTGVHSGTDRDMFVRVRDGGTAGDNIPTKTFEATTPQFLATPQTVAAQRITDA